MTQQRHGGNSSKALDKSETDFKLCRVRQIELLEGIEMKMAKTRAVGTWVISEHSVSR
jgi:hypothetical protein